MADLSPYKGLTFQIHVEPKSEDAALDPRTVVVRLACMDGSKTTAPAMVQKYDGKFDDGKWHKITIPIADLSHNEGAQFHPNDHPVAVALIPQPQCAIASSALARSKEEG